MRIDIKVARLIVLAAGLMAFCLLYVVLRIIQRPSTQQRVGTGYMAGDRCIMCALVGTSGTLIGSHKGDSIDSNECIFRIGLAPTYGYEEDVGSMTTARVVDSLRFSPFLRSPQRMIKKNITAERFFIYDSQASDRGRFIDLVDERNMTWLSYATHDAVYASLSKYSGKLYVENIHGQRSPFWFVVYLMELSKCQIISVYGVPDADLCKREPYVNVKSQYWKKDPLPLCKHGQDWSLAKLNSSLPLDSPTVFERKAFQNWAKGQNVDFHSPKWPDL